MSGLIHTRQLVYICCIQTNIYMDILILIDLKTNIMPTRGRYYAVNS